MHYLKPPPLVVVLDYFYDEAVLANEEAIQQEIAYRDRVQCEDEEICAQVQIGLQSRAYSQGRYSVKREEGVYHFRNLLRASYRAAVENPASIPPA